MSKKLNVLFAFSVLTALTSCGTPSASASSSQAETSSTPAVLSSTASDEFDPSKPVTISFWHSMGKGLEGELQGFITRFNKIYPNITIEESPQGSYDDVLKNVKNGIATGAIPTMAYCYEDHVATYLDKNAVLDMSSYVTDETYGFGHNPEGKDLGDGSFDDFVEGYLSGDDYSKEGWYSFPYSKSTELMFYNKTKFEANGWDVPKTWEEVWELCDTMKNSTIGQTTEGFIPVGYDSDANWLISSFEQKGIPYTTAKPASGESNFLFNNDEAKAHVTKLKEYYDSGYFTTQGISGGYTSGLFTAEQCMISIGSSGGTSHQYPTGDTFEVGVASVPQADLNAKKVISQGPSICFFNRATKAETTAAWLFYKFITNTQNSAYWATKSGYTPVRVSSYSDSIYTSAMSATSGQAGLIAEAGRFVGSEESGYTDAFFTSPAFKGSSTAREEMDKLLPSVMLGEKTVNKAFDDAMSECLFAA
ncbi:MAG: extracellular solute-binding protein [Bacilli bacterium]|nr:extracellular solute-binding protein [Bacilli bacterium]